MVEGENWTPEVAFDLHTCAVRKKWCKIEEMEHYFKISLLTPPRLSFLSTYKAEADLELAI